MSRPADLIGQRFVRLVVMYRAENTTGGKAQWFCACDCGQSAVVSTDKLRRNNTRSCGCLKRELAAANMRRLVFRHGLGRTRSYGTWGNMMERCFDQRDGKYRDYGARGITVCERWRNFENFYADMGERPKGLTIERIANDGNYEPGNCRWATPKEQANNTRRNRRISFGGETLTLTEWSQRLGISPSTLHAALAFGSVERAGRTAR